MHGNGDGRAVDLHLNLAVVSLQRIRVRTGQFADIQRLALSTFVRIIAFIPVQLQPRSAGHVGDDTVFLILHDGIGGRLEGGVVDQSRPDTEAQCAVLRIRPLVRHAFLAHGLHFNAVVVIRIQVARRQGHNDIAAGADLRGLSASVKYLIVIVVFTALDVHHEVVDVIAILLFINRDGDGEVLALAWLRGIQGNGEVGNFTGADDVQMDGIAVNRIRPIHVAIPVRFGDASCDSEVGRIIRRPCPGKATLTRRHIIPPAVADADLGAVVAYTPACQREGDGYIHRRLSLVIRAAAQSRRDFILRCGGQDDVLFSIALFIPPRAGRNANRKGIANVVIIEDISVDLVFPDRRFSVNLFPVFVEHRDAILCRVLYGANGESK